MAASASISPGALVPISMTAIASSVRVSTVIGTPMRLFRFPWVAATFTPLARSAAAVSSLVVVFPAEPVIPTTRPPHSSRWACARQPSASRVSSTAT